MSRNRSSSTFVLAIAATLLLSTFAAQREYDTNNVTAPNFVPDYINSAHTRLDNTVITTIVPRTASPDPTSLPTASATIPLGSPTVQGTPSATPTEPHEQEDQVGGFEDTYRNHRYPLDTIPPDPVGAALDWSSRNITDVIPDGMDITGGSNRMTNGIPLSSTVWTNIGPQPVREYSGALVGGRVTALVTDPVSPTIVYAGMAGGGVWKSSNCCDSNTIWTPLDPTYPQMSTAEIGALVIDPNNHTTIYAATGEDALCRVGCLGSRGILKSTNGGTTWTQQGTSTFIDGSAGYPLHLSAIAVDPRNSNTVVTGAYAYGIYGSTAPTATSGVYISADAGVNWQRCAIAAPGMPTTYTQWISDLVLDNSTNPTTIYAAIGQSSLYDYNNPNLANGIYTATLPVNPSINPCPSPSSWRRILKTGDVFANATHPEFGRIRLAQYNHNILYAVIGEAYGSSEYILGVVSTSDAGHSWPNVYDESHFHDCGTDNPPRFISRSNLYIKVDPIYPNIVYAGISTLYRSPNGGADFNDLLCATGTNRIHEDQHSFSFITYSFFSGYSFIIGNDGGLWSFNAGATQSTNLNSTLNNLQFYGGDLTANFASDTNAQALGGTQDNSTEVYTATTSPDPRVWEEVRASAYGGDGSYTAIEPNNRTSYEEQPFGQLSCSTTGVAGFFNECAGGWIDQPTNNEHTGFNTPFVLDHNNCNPCRHLALGTSRVWESTTGGLSSSAWYTSSNFLTKVYSEGHYIRALAFAPSDTATVYAGTSDGAMSYTSNANTGSPSYWVDITVANGVMPNRSVSGIAVSPVETITAYVAFDGFNENTPSTPGHLYRVRLCKISCGITTATWTDVSGNLPNIPIYSVIVNPMNANQVFIGSEIGFYFTNNINASPVVWNRFQNGLPIAAINQLTIDVGNSTLVAWTNGRGAYAVQLPAWRIFPSPNEEYCLPAGSDNKLTAVSVVNSTDVWAAGNANHPCPGSLGRELDQIQHWNGTSWMTATIPFNNTATNSLNGISVISTTSGYDGWAVGVIGFGTLCLHGTGYTPSWNFVDCPYFYGVSVLSAVASIATNNVWTVGHQWDTAHTHLLIEHWDGLSWQAVVSQTNVITASDSTLYAVAGKASNDVWAVGSMVVTGTNQTLIEHWNGTSWQRVSSPSPGNVDNVLTAVTVISSTDAWAVGYYQQGQLTSPLTLHWNGTSWQFVANTAGGKLYGVSAVSSNDVWAVGTTYFSVAMHWDGTTWKQFNSENVVGIHNPATILSAVAMVSHNDGWAVGYNTADGGPFTLIERWVPYTKWWP